MSTQINPSLIHSGHVVQYARSENITMISTSNPCGTTNDSFPAATGGALVAAVTITPKSASNKLMVWTVCHIVTTGQYWMSTIITRDALASALSQASIVCTSNGWMVPLTCGLCVTAGSTASTTFGLRFGTQSGYTTYINGYGSRYGGGSSISYIEVTEIAA